MDGRRRRAWKEGFDSGIGFFGFFAAAFFVLCLLFQILGQDALYWAWATVVTAAMAVALLFIKRGVLRRMDEAEADRTAPEPR